MLWNVRHESEVSWKEWWPWNAQKGKWLAATLTATADTGNDNCQVSDLYWVDQIMIIYTVDFTSWKPFKVSVWTSSILQQFLSKNNAGNLKYLRDLLFKSANQKHWVQRLSRSSCSILWLALVIYNLSRLKHVLHRCVCDSLLPKSPFPHSNSLSELY